MEEFWIRCGTVLQLFSGILHSSSSLLAAIEVQVSLFLILFSNYHTTVKKGYLTLNSIFAIPAQNSDDRSCGAYSRMMRLALEGGVICLDGDSAFGRYLDESSLFLYAHRHQKSRSPVSSNRSIQNRILGLQISFTARQQHNHHHELLLRTS